MTLHHGDCLDVMRELPDASVDAVVTDPPYGLEFMGRDWDRLWVEGDKGQQGRIDGKGGMDTWGKRPQYQAGAAAQAWHEQWATEAFRVLKPGGYILAFGGTRTYHRLASAIEDAGFEIRDTLMWIYASGFPKSLDVSKALDKVAGAEREVVGRRKVSRELPNDVPFGQGLMAGNVHAHEVDVTAPATDLARKWEGWGTALKPAHEPIVMARKPLIGTVAQNVTRYGTGALNIDGARIGTGEDKGNFSGNWGFTEERGWNPNGGKWTDAEKELAATMHATECASHLASTGCRTGHLGRARMALMDSPTKGRWPSNVLLSSPELFDERNPHVVGSGVTAITHQGKVEGGATSIYGSDLDGDARMGPGDSGGYSRFFIIPKADRAERERGLAGAPKRDSEGRDFLSGTEGDLKMWPDGKLRPRVGVERVQRANTHPTVKPIDLMRHLVRLVTPPGGTVLDPFAGSGSTLIAAEMEGFAWIGIEREAEYVAIAEGRLNGVQRGLGLR